MSLEEDPDSCGYDRTPYERDPALKSKLDAEVTGLMIHYFHKLIAEHNVPVDQAHRIECASYLGWLQERMNLDQPNRVEICKAAEVTLDDAWACLQHHTHDPAGPLNIQNVWPQVIFSLRPIPKQPLRSLHIMTMLMWEDGRVYPHSVYCPVEVSDGPLTDAAIGMIVASRAKEIIKQVASHGLDGMHSAYSDDLGGENMFNIIMGLLLRGLQQLGPEHRVYCEKYVRLFQSLFFPPIPPDLKARFEARRQAAKQKQQGQATGGWDA